MVNLVSSYSLLVDECSLLRVLSHGQGLAAIAEQKPLPMPFPSTH